LIAAKLVSCGVLYGWISGGRVVIAGISFTRWAARPLLVGSSGCGESTTLLLVAGLESVESGHITIVDANVPSSGTRVRDVFRTDRPTAARAGDKGGGVAVVDRAASRTPITTSQPESRIWIISVWRFSTTPAAELHEWQNWPRRLGRRAVAQWLVVTIVG
jgi:ABC-type cobalamin/Fe3+-siderophores transport system ATPase subunit